MSNQADQAKNRGVLTITQHEQRWRQAARDRAEAFGERMERERRLMALNATIGSLRWRIQDLDHQLEAMKRLAMTELGRRHFEVAARDLQRVFFEGLVEHAMPSICKMDRDRIAHSIMHFLRMYSSMGGMIPPDLVPAHAVEALLRIADDREIGIIPRGPRLGGGIADSYQIEVAVLWPARQEYHYMINMPRR